MFKLLRECVKSKLAMIDMATWEYFHNMLNKLSVGVISDEEPGMETINNWTISV
jgi:hypothetical protein